ncbi:Phox-like protein [Cutaneotrichosporon oleaginosum]|uniref:Phox-like protein n=1 Tax=Cutaneotrichosporon oleaginosum TaxID=879819 RepID=A0A0J0XMB6_9TREE|nr:Phox-like protein [Cutaneotrichosporon oleaginosum]KLT42203.1 Phox-like protein [Cutaneotrichosporon oleaginosum]
MKVKSINITDVLTVQKPSRHIAYTVQVSTPTRSWSVNRRYNDFVALDAELRKSTGKEPPAQLPPKHWFARTINDEEKIRQRRVQLEQYLRTILTTKDARWRKEYGFADFLAVPAPTKAGSSGQPFTATTWATEQTAVAGVLRQARAALLKRDALAREGNPASRASGGEARRLLRDAGPRIDMLEKSLPELSLAAGEERRREDMVANLRAEVGNLLRMAEAGYRPPHRTPPPEANMPGAMPETSSAFAPKARVFGKKPQETTETRALDDRGLVQLQQSKMGQQDEQLGVLSGLLRKQRRMGEEIADEIAVQNEMLDQLDGDVTKFGTKMARAKRDLNRF